MILIEDHNYNTMSIILIISNIMPISTDISVYKKFFKWVTQFAKFGLMSLTQENYQISLNAIFEVKPSHCNILDKKIRPLTFCGGRGIELKICF